MPETSRPTSGAVFGVIQFFTLGTLILAGALLAVLLQSIPHGATNLSEAISHTIDYKENPWLVMALWGMELVAYGLLTVLFSQRLAIVVSGIVLGLATRLISSTLMVTLLSASSGMPFSSLIVRADGDLWVYRLLAILTTVLAVAVPYRRILTTGFGFHEEDAAGAKPTAFSFNNSAAPRPTTPAPSSARTISRFGRRAAQKVVAPPEGFTPVVPVENVYGMVNIPSSVILESVPEAQPFLNADGSVRVRLAFIVPQLSQATVWLMWQQIFPKGVDDPNAQAQTQQEAGIRDRWVRIPAKYYISQVPQEHFVVVKHPPAWMALSEVPQEQQFLIHG